MADSDFFEAQTAASAIKARIVSAYFSVWAKIILKGAPSERRHHQ